MAAWSLPQCRMVALLGVVAFGRGIAVPPQVVAWSSGTAAPLETTPASWVGYRLD